jgi:molecular chaperone Hsp33
MTDQPIIVPDQPGSEDNLVIPFQIDGQDIRGRTVRMGTTVEQILSAHDYPEPIAIILGEVLVLTALLGSIIKFDGKLTIQTKGDGIITLLVADYETPGKIRGYASYNEKSLSTLGKNPSIKALLGKGYMAMTIDQGADMERYQGIVELEGESIADCATKYFENSEQTPSKVKLAISRDAITNHWRAGGIMVQHLARGETGQARITDEERDEAWGRIGILMETVKKEELSDPQLTLKELLFRLYHEDGVRIYDPVPLHRHCKCTAQYIETILSQFSAEDRKEMIKDDKVVVNCAFCNKDFLFDE